MAKIFCPNGDEGDNHWIKVKELSVELSELKKKIAEEELRGETQKKKKADSSMAAKFLDSIDASKKVAGNKRKNVEEDEQTDATSTATASPRKTVQMEIMEEYDQTDATSTTTASPSKTGRTTNYDSSTTVS